MQTPFAHSTRSLGKGHYYDTESGLYYANGSYYDPELGLHVDASEISSIIDNAFTLFALDRNGMMCDNTKMEIKESVS